MKKVVRRKVEFQVAAAPGSTVSVAGTFNDWDPKKNPMKDNPGSGLYKTALMLPTGMYEYKFVVNGIWRPDAHSPQKVPDGYGAQNSVVCVKESM